MAETGSKIGMVGVGRMGANIALRLHDVGYLIAAVYDAHGDAARRTAGQTGAFVCATLAEVTKRSEIIITVVSDDAAMERIFAETGDSLLVDARGKSFINCATVSPHVHVAVEKLAEARGAGALEACMASSITQARDGTLYLMAGGSAEVYSACEPLLRSMSSALRYIGPAGRAAQVKALVNMVMNINTAGLAEGLGLGDALGLDLSMLREVFGQTGAASRVLETDGADMQKRDHETYFSAAHAAKDSGIAVALARSVELDVPLARAAQLQYERMIAVGLGELDKSGVAELTFKGRAAHELAPAAGTERK